MKKIDIFIPLKGKSQRVPGKNMRPFGGRPLFHTILATLEQCERIGGVYIDTDSEVIGESASSFESVTVLMRKPELLGHDISVNWLIKDFLVDHPDKSRISGRHTAPTLCCQLPQSMPRWPRTSRTRSNEPVHRHSDPGTSVRQGHQGAQSQS